jgi:hypothetical protein
VFYFNPDPPAACVSLKPRCRGHRHFNIDNGM